MTKNTNPPGFTGLSRHACASPRARMTAHTKLRAKTNVSPKFATQCALTKEHDQC